MKTLGRHVLIALSIIYPAVMVVVITASAKDVKPRLEKRPGLQIKSDPFQPFLERDALRKRAREKVQVVPLSPLLQKNLDQFRLKGIAFDGQRYLALVEDNRGRFYTVSTGSKIGTRNGRVKEIYPDYMVVEERFKTSSGQEKVELITIKLPRAGQGGKP